MTKRTWGVGIIGIQPGRSWAAVAHIPALRALPNFTVAALSTTRQSSANAAAAEFGVPKAYDNHQALVADPAVDIVAVTVKVPAHLELVRSALAAGKHVYCEWPLGNGLAEGEEMAQQAARRKLLGAVGLQARLSPVINYVRDLLRQGHIGEVLSTTLIGSGMAWGPVMDIPNAYTADKTNGATLLTIPFGHTVDALRYCLGDFQEVSATLANRRRSFVVAETGEQRPMTSEDQVIVAGTLKSGAVASIHYRGGAARGTNLLWEINGSEGDLQITAIAGHAQMFELTLRGARAQQQALEPMPIPAQYVKAPAAATPFGANVAVAYQCMANDLEHGTRTCPDFGHAVEMHRLIAAVEESAASGRRVHLS